MANMDSLGLLVILAFSIEGLHSLPISGFRLTPPENEWAQLGETVSLRCKSDKPIRSCAWMTPYDKNYVLEKGLKAEGGRLSYYSEEEDASEGVTECGIRIDALEEMDFGKWSCNIGVVEGDEIKSATGQASIRLASPPSDIQLTFTPEIDLNGSIIEPKASCEVKHASPKPIVQWMIDGENVIEPEIREDLQEENDAYVQTLMNLRDVMESENVTLTCIVTHMALNNSLSESLDIYVEEDESFLDDVLGSDATLDVDYFGLLEDDQSELNELPVLVVIVVAITLTLVGIFFILHRRGKLNNCCRGGRHDVLDMDKNGTPSDLEGKINAVDDSESTDSIVKQDVVPESESSSSSSSESEATKPNQESNNPGEIVKASKDNDVTLTVNRFLSKFSLKNLSQHPAMEDEKGDEVV